MNSNKTRPAYRHNREFTGTDIALRRQWERVKVAAVILLVFWLMSEGSNV
jgi:hypothetical protein